jgi:hypothetical protein
MATSEAPPVVPDSIPVQTPKSVDKPGIEEIVHTVDIPLGMPRTLVVVRLGAGIINIGVRHV